MKKYVCKTACFYNGNLYEPGNPFESTSDVPKHFEEVKSPDSTIEKIEDDKPSLEKGKASRASK